METCKDTWMWPWIQVLGNETDLEVGLKVGLKVGFKVDFVGSAF